MEKSVSDLDPVLVLYDGSELNESNLWFLGPRLDISYQSLKGLFRIKLLGDAYPELVKQVHDSLLNDFVVLLVRNIAKVQLIDIDLPLVVPIYVKHQLVYISQFRPS